MGALLGAAKTTGPSTLARRRHPRARPHALLHPRSGRLYAPGHPAVQNRRCWHNGRWVGALGGGPAPRLSASFCLASCRPAALGWLGSRRRARCDGPDSRARPSRRRRRARGCVCVAHPQLPPWKARRRAGGDGGERADTRLPGRGPAALACQTAWAGFGREVVNAGGRERVGARLTGLHPVGGGSVRTHPWDVGSSAGMLFNPCRGHGLVRMHDSPGIRRIATASASTAPRRPAARPQAAIDLGGGSVQEAFAIPSDEAAAAPDGYVTRVWAGGSSFDVYVHR